MAWTDRLQDASFRGVPFKTDGEGSGVGRRVQTHEYPNRDKPYTEDLGRITFRPVITTYVTGDDCFEQRDRLIEALNKPGPGTLIHPTLGELKVCVDGEIRVSTEKGEGRLQMTALEAAGCDQIFEEHASGRKSNRPVLKKMIATMQAGDESSHQGEIV